MKRVKSASVRTSVLRILESARAEHLSPQVALSDPAAAAIMTDFAAEIVSSITWPQHVNRRDPEQALMERLYATLPRLDEHLPPLAQLQWLTITLRGAAMDFIRRDGDRIRTTQYAASTRVCSRRDREAIATNITSTAPSAEDLVAERIQAQELSAAVAEAAASNPTCETCQRALSAVGDGNVDSATMRQVRFHLHLLVATIDI